MSNALAAAPLRYHFEIIQSTPLPANTFTQGLSARDNVLWISSGRYYQSKLLKTRFDNGELLAEYHWPANRFAEGIALTPASNQADEQLCSLSWRAEELHCFDPQKLTLRHIKRYSGEGWGLTRWGDQLVRSDGSAQLWFHEWPSFKPNKSITVSREGEPVSRLNALSTAPDGTLWANIWGRTLLIQIDPATGEVIGEVDLASLAKENNSNDPDSVLNGLLWTTDGETLWVTGKLWSHRYLIKLIKKE